MRLKQLLVVAWIMVIPTMAVAQSDECRGACGEVNGVPEPETLALLAVGAIALFIARRRNKK